MSSKWSSGGSFLRAATPKPSLLMKNINESAHKMNTGPINLRWMHLMSPELLPRCQWIIGRNIMYCFSFLFLSVRNLTEVYEQVNAPKITLFKSVLTSTRGNWPQPRLINQRPEQLLEAILHLIYINRLKSSNRMKLYISFSQFYEPLDDYFESFLLPSSATFESAGG